MSESLACVPGCNGMAPLGHTAACWKFRAEYHQIEAEEGRTAKNRSLAQLATERARAEAAEGREERLREVVQTYVDRYGYASDGNLRPSFRRLRAALAGTPEGEPTLAPRESYPATIIVTEVRRGVPTIHPDEIAPRDGAFEGEQG